MAVLLAPGQNVVTPPPPNTNFQEYPKHMVHPGFSPGRADKEIKVVDENGRATGQLVYTGGESVRYPPVLVFDASQEAYHASQGYRSVGKSDPAAFARAVASASPVNLDYKPIEYPKWCHGKQVLDANEEREWLHHLGIDKDGNPVVEATAEDVTEQLAISSEPAGEPALNAEANTLEVWAGPTELKNTIALLNEPTEEDEIAALEARLAALKAKKAAPVDGELLATGKMLMDHAEAKKRGEDQGFDAPPSGPITAAPTELFATESAADRKKREKSEKIKAGLARRRAEQEAARRASGEDA